MENRTRDFTTHAAAHIILSHCLASIGEAIRNVKEHVDANDQTRASTCKLYARFRNRMCYVLYRDRWVDRRGLLCFVPAAAAPAGRELASGCLTGGVASIDGN